jgi:hypothetical protein
VSRLPLSSAGLSSRPGLLVGAGLTLLAGVLVVDGIGGGLAFVAGLAAAVAGAGVLSALRHSRSLRGPPRWIAALAASLPAGMLLAATAVVGGPVATAMVGLAAGAVAGPALTVRTGQPARTVIEQRYGIPWGHQRQFQWLADRHGYVIDVRPTNPLSVRWIKRGALPKPAAIRAKTITHLDVWLGADPEYVGAVGLFDPILPVRGDVPGGLWDALVGRYHMRRAEYAREYAKVVALVRFELGGRGNTVVFGYDARGRRQPVTGDHDLFDVRHSDGRRLTPYELLRLVVEMLKRGMGVQHPALRYWRPSDPGDIEARDAIDASHEPGGDPLVRFAPGQRVRLVHAATPVWSGAPRSAEADTPRRLSWVRAVLRMVIRASVVLTVASLAVAAGAVVVGVVG